VNWNCSTLSWLKVLFLCKHTQPDISPAIAFLTTRVQHPTREDWMKSVMRYLKGTVHDVLRADGSGSVKWYTNASSMVQLEYRSHTGAIMTMGVGTVSSISHKQGMNTRSSTETEVVVADEAVRLMI
jgi:hypothetical protein